MKNSELRYRFMAALIDMVIIIIFCVLIIFLSSSYKIISALFSGDEIRLTLNDFIRILASGLFIEIFIVFYSCLIPLATRGQTFGMVMTKIRYVRFDYSDCDFNSYFMRNVVFKTILLLLTFGLILIADFLVLRRRDDCLSLADLFSKTKVVDRLDY